MYSSQGSTYIRLLYRSTVKTVEPIRYLSLLKLKALYLMKRYTILLQNYHQALLSLTYTKQEILISLLLDIISMQLILELGTLLETQYWL